MIVFAGAAPNKRGRKGVCLPCRLMAEAVRLAELAHTTTCQAVESFAAVAKNHADLGAIAVLAEYAYRPLKNKASELRALLNQ